MVTRDEALEALYAELPQVDCIGSCWDSCSRIGMTVQERRRTEAAGVVIPDGFAGNAPRVCPALTLLHRCSVYEVRPLICRLWGVTEDMPCTYGCKPRDGRALLTDAETYEYLARAFDLAGQHALAAQIRQPWQENPERAAEMMREHRRQVAREILVRDVRRRRLVESGKSVLYVRGRGQISKQPPASGANAS